MAERFQAPAVTAEVIRLVRSRPQDVCHVPEAVRFFLGDRISSAIVPDLKVRKLAWKHAGVRV